MYVNGPFFENLPHVWGYATYYHGVFCQLVSVLNQCSSNPWQNYQATTFHKVSRFDHHVFHPVLSSENVMTATIIRLVLFVLNLVLFVTTLTLERFTTQHMKNCIFYRWNQKYPHACLHK